jgi:hypothetical protein
MMKKAKGRKYSTKEKLSWAAKAAGIITAATLLIKALLAFIGTTGDVFQFFGKPPMSTQSQASIAAPPPNTPKSGDSYNQNFVSTGSVQNSQITQTQNINGGKR